MGAAMALVHARAGLRTALLGTAFDAATVDALRSGGPHPALGVEIDSGIEAHSHDEWSQILGDADRIVVAVSSDGLADVVAEASAMASPSAAWVVATKGWDSETLRTPSEVLVAVLGSDARTVVLAGPALAPEVVAEAPTAMVCASTNAELAGIVAASFATAGLSMTVTDDVAGAEIAAAYKNVTAIAVGMCEGLGERLPERVYVHRFANARAALFARGLADMTRLAVPKGGRAETILGLAGAGDLYVTCLGGRNGNFGRLLGVGQTAEQAAATIGSTVEGVANTGVSLTVAQSLGVELVVARAVSSVLTGHATAEEAIAEAMA